MNTTRTVSLIFALCLLSHITAAPKQAESSTLQPTLPEKVNSAMLNCIQAYADAKLELAKAAELANLAAERWINASSPSPITIAMHFSSGCLALLANITSQYFQDATTLILQQKITTIDIASNTPLALSTQVVQAIKCADKDMGTAIPALQWALEDLRATGSKAPMQSNCIIQVLEASIGAITALGWVCKSHHDLSTIEDLKPKHRKDLEAQRINSLEQTRLQAEKARQAVERHVLASAKLEEQFLSELD